MVDWLRGPNGKVAFGIAASAALFTLTLFNPGMHGVATVSLFFIWFAVRGGAGSMTQKARWALTGLLAWRWRWRSE